MPGMSGCRVESFHDHEKRFQDLLAGVSAAQAVFGLAQGRFGDLRRLAVIAN